MNYVGLDLHWRTSTLNILDERGKQVKQQRVRGSWAEVIETIAGLSGPVAVCYEASCGYGAMHDRLKQVAGRVVVAHPGQLRLIFKARRKSDRVDAAKLAKLLYLDAVPTVHVPGIEVRSWRKLIEFRVRTVGKRTRVKNQIGSLLRDQGMVTPRGFGGLWSKKGLAWLGQIEWPTPLLAVQCDMLLDELQQAQQNVKRLTRELDRIARSHPGVQLLRTIPGVGPRKVPGAAEAVVAYIDRPDRFSRNRQVGAYFGLVPCQDQSAERNRLGHITKEGPGTLRKLLVEAAWQGVRRSAHLRQHFDHLVAGDKDRRKIAIVAVAHYLVRCMHAMLSSGEAWRHDT